MSEDKSKQDMSRRYSDFIAFCGQTNISRGKDRRVQIAYHKVKGAQCAPY